MVVGEWYTDEFGNRARMIYNAKTVDFESVYDLPREVSPAQPGSVPCPWSVGLPSGSGREAETVQRTTDL
jgi:hypothetical protein